MSEISYTAPIVNLNGSTAADLISYRSHAREAIEGAIAHLKACAPHPRDYQTDRGQRYQAAVSVHRQHLNELEDISQWLSDEIADLQEQQDAIEARKR